MTTTDPPSRGARAGRAPAWRLLPPLAAALLPVAILAIFWVANPDVTLLHDDNAIYFQPNITVAQERLWAGDVPFWKHSSGLGGPMFADGQPGVFYAPYMVAYAIAVKVAGRPDLLMKTIALLHAALGGLGMYLFARRLVRHPGAALVASLGYALNGFWVACAMNWIVMAALQSWLPLLCWAMLRVMDRERGRAGDVFVAAGLWAVQGYAGHPQGALMNAAVMGLVALVVAGRARAWGRLGRALAVFIAGGMLVMPLWLPMYMLATESIRLEGMLSFDDVTGLSLPPSRLLGAFFPGLAAPTGNKYLYVFAFAGAPAALLGVVGLIAGARRRRMWWWIAAVVLFAGIPLTLGRHLPLTSWIFSLPFVNLFRWPFKNLFILHLGWSIAVAGGLAYLTARPRPRVLAAAFVASLLIGVPPILLLVLPPHRSIGILAAAWPVAALTFAAAQFMGSGRRRRWLGPILTVGAVASLWFSVVSLRDFGVWDPPPAQPGPYVAALERPLRTLIVSEQERGRQFPPWEARAYSIPDLGGAPSANGYSPIALLRHVRLLGTNMFGFVRPEARPLMLSLIRDGALIDALSVGTLIVDAYDEEMVRALQDNGYVQREIGRRTVAFENPDPMPRAYFVENVVTFPDTEAPLAAVHAPGAPLRTTAFVASSAAIKGGPGKVSHYQQRPDGIRIECSTPGPAYLVVNSTWEWGWRTTVDGALAFTDRANYALIGVEIPAAGEHVVDLTYIPRDLIPGNLAAVIALVLLTWLTLRERRAARHASPPPAPPPPPPAASGPVE